MRNDRYLCGIRARVTAGLGLWQRAFGSAADLTEADCAKARVARTGGVRKAGVRRRLKGRVGVGVVLAGRGPRII